MSAILANVVDEWYDGKRHHVIGFLTFTGSYSTGGLALDFALAGIATELPPTWFDAPYYAGYFFQYNKGVGPSDGKLQVFSASGAVQATGTITSNDTNVSNLDTVTIGSFVYTFKTVVSNPFDVLIGGSADASLLNLIEAINLTGTEGTTYGTGTTINTLVTAASSVTSHAFEVTAIVGGLVGNTIATTTTAVTLSWGGATLSGGSDATPSSEELSAGAFPDDIAGYNVPFYAIWPQLI
jgi:hypothetical protein